MTKLKLSDLAVGMAVKVDGRSNAIGKVAALVPGYKTEPHGKTTRQCWAEANPFKPEPEPSRRAFDNWNFQPHWDSVLVEMPGRPRKNGQPNLFWKLCTLGRIEVVK